MEEDIEILEEMKKDIVYDSDEDYENQIAIRQIQAIENILKRIDFLERKAGIKINQEIDKMKLELYKDYVPKSKIKEKIEEIIKSNPAQDEEWDGTDYKVTSEENFAIEMLEDLLEE